MLSFLEQTILVWEQGSLSGKVGTVLSTTATQHGGNEAVLLQLLKTLAHHGMVLVGLPFSYHAQRDVDQVSGGTPYGATSIVGGKASRMPLQIDIDAATYQGAHATRIATALSL